MLTSKRNSLVLFIEQYLQPQMSYRATNFFTRTIRIGIRTICDFATRRFRTLPGSLTPINDPTSIAIASRLYISVHKCRTQHFSGDIINRSVIYPMGRPYCFRGNPNNNVLQMLLINVQYVIHSTGQPFCFHSNPNNHLLLTWLICFHTLIMSYQHG